MKHSFSDSFIIFKVILTLFSAWKILHHWDYLNKCKVSMIFFLFLTSYLIIKCNATILLKSVTQTLQVKRETWSKKFSTDNVVLGFFPEKTIFAECVSISICSASSRTLISDTLLLSLWCQCWQDSLRVNIKCVLILWALAASELFIWRHLLTTIKFDTCRFSITHKPSFLRQCFATLLRNPGVINVLHLWICKAGRVDTDPWHSIFY